MPVKINAVGLSRGGLTCLEEVDKKVKCLCNCGNVKLINRNHFLSGNILSCGCLRIDKLVAKSKTHGMSNSRLYSIWSNMKSRCYNPNVDCFKHYGGKGVTVCEDWLTFEGFINNLPDGYGENLELDRIDGSLGYSKSNCRWATRSVQCFNKQTNYNGVTFCERDGLWRAKITKDGKSYQKYFKSKEDATIWRQAKESELFT